MELKKRSNRPDSIAGSLKIIAEIMVSRRDTVQKALEDGLNNKNFLGFHQAHTQIAQVGEELFKSFSDAKYEFENDIIQRTRYVSHLKSFQEFFEIDNLKKIDIPETMQAGVILKEIARFL